MTYTIGEVAERLQVTASTLRYYDKEGLLPFVERSEGGIRQFKDADFEWLTIIECLKATKMPLKDIRVFVDWCMQGDETIQQRFEMFAERKAAVERQMAELKKTLDIVNYKYWYYKTAVEAGTAEVHRARPGYTPPVYDPQEVE